MVKRANEKEIKVNVLSKDKLYLRTLRTVCTTYYVVYVVNTVPQSDRVHILECKVHF